jgi:hypothetical protein
VTACPRNATLFRSSSTQPRYRPPRFLAAVFRFWGCDVKEIEISSSSSAATNPARGPSREHLSDRSAAQAGEEGLLQLVLLVEEVLFLRWQDLGDDPAHNDERIAMKAIANDLWAIKIFKLRWPDIKQDD